jgi:hypothetical protein
MVDLDGLQGYVSMLKLLLEPHIESRYPHDVRNRRRVLRPLRQVVRLVYHVAIPHVCGADGYDMFIGDTRFGDGDDEVSRSKQGRESNTPENTPRRDTVA